MKILKIRFENIHSLKGEHEVDFADGILADAGLFAITGPTGSGKSTLLDVITLALYNRIARVDKNVSNAILEDDGGIMTRNMTSCYAEVEYRVNGKNYRSHWSIARNRNNNLNARKQELVVVATGEILESGTKTPDKNQEVIGLSYSQFVKAMVLSQGEFSKLLQAPRNERNKLLEDITGAKSYREIGRAVYLRFKGIEKQIELKEASLEGIELLSEEAISEKKETLKTLTKNKPETEKAFQTASEKIKVRQELQQRQTEEKQLKTTKEALEKDLTDFKPYKRELEQHEKLSKYNVNLRDYDLAIKEVGQYDTEYNSLIKSKDEAQKLQQSYLGAVAKLLKENVTIKTANEKLDAFRSKITTLQAEEKKKQSEASLFQGQVSKEVGKINQLGYNLSIAEHPKQFKTQVQSFTNSLVDTIENSGADSFEQLNSQLEVVRNSNEIAAQLLTKKEQLVKNQAQLKTYQDKLQAEKKSLEEDTKAIADLDKKVSTLKKEVETLEKTLEQQRKHLRLEEYRLQLEPEQPCPLCGSKHHPYATEEPYFDAKEELLKEKKESLDRSAKHLITLNQKNKFQVKEIDSSSANIESLRAEESQTLDLLKALANELKWDHTEDLESLKTHRIALNQQILNLEKSKQAFQADSILKDLNESLKQWENAMDAFNSLNKERVALYDGQDINEKTNVLSSRLTRSVANLSSLAKQQENIEEKLKEAKSVKTKKEENLKEILIKEKFENLQGLRKAIISEGRAGKIRKRENELKERKTRLSEKETVLEKTLKQLTEKDDGLVSFEVLTSSAEETKKKWLELLENITIINERLEADTKLRERQQVVINQLSLLKKDRALWKSMNDLIGDATGNKFSNFVQDLTLEQLIGFANKRLSEFSDRYLLDIPTADEAEKSDTLKIFDKYMGNARRSVRTLSGGETFLVSLAMAFALSDIAAKNVKIKSLFIDEGFGTLDPETLDQAITILEKMQNEGDKSVGVISHVSALKERITTQVKLEKGSLGYSTLAVVN
ncbi:AAA family ATPase [Aequorivita marina]|uniref:AAA family ATPase n=1 Tax=Aequorivita marina TaxID=3073654 RepID=UPI00287434FB|nr:AAA family ATPase [Aequorivita sp. S2608]MDS1297775.1 AAA family ATPase [Aequorivita sp. S2608]